MTGDRITDRDLDAVLARINRTFGEKEAAYTRDDNGFRANVGTFVLDHAYGGVELQRLMNEGGGVSDVLRLGHQTKRQCRESMFAFLAGVELWDEHLKEVSQDA